MVLEAKGLGNPLSEVLKIPVGYVEDLGPNNVNYILITDGANLFMHSKTKKKWNPDPVGYLSIRSL